MTRLLTVFVAVACVQASAQVPATQPAGDQLVASANEAISKSQLGDFRKQLEVAITESLEDLATLDLPGITRLAAMRQLALRFESHQAEMASIEQLKWLLARPRLLQTLLLAMDDDDSPQRVLEVLAMLRNDFGEKLESVPDLATALCVVWDDPSPSGYRNLRVPKADQARMLASYYVRQKSRQKFDVTVLPWQLAVYVVHNTASADEIAWAQRYSGRGNIGGAFFDVPYDYGDYYGTSTNQRTDDGYTLPNLVRRGGTCSDQAYFAMTVARSIGVPATVCIGAGTTADVGHAWVGYLETRGQDVAWNFSEGRYPEYQNCRSAIINPQNRRPITDADLALLLELRNTTAESRLASLALLRSAQLVEGDARAAVLMKAISLSPGNARAWVELAQMGSAGRLSAGRRAEFEAAVATYAARNYPDFAARVLISEYAGLPVQQRVAALDKLKSMFTRPDLLAEVGIAKGDALRDAGKTREALAAYGDVLNRFPNAGPIVLMAVEPIDRILSDQRDLVRLAAVYRSAWSRLPMPQSTALLGGSPYYRLGQRYVDILRIVAPGSAELSNAQSRLDALMASVDSRRPAR